MSEKLRVGPGVLSKFVRWWHRSSQHYTWRNALRSLFLTDWGITLALGPLIFAHLVHLTSCVCLSELIYLALPSVPPALFIQLGCSFLLQLLCDWGLPFACGVVLPPQQITSGVTKESSSWWKTMCDYRQLQRLCMVALTGDWCSPYARLGAQPRHYSLWRAFQSRTGARLANPGTFQPRHSSGASMGEDFEDTFFRLWLSTLYFSTPSPHFLPASCMTSTVPYGRKWNGGSWHLFQV